MLTISGENWTGCFQDNTYSTARGSTNGYSWCFIAKGKSWILEIAEDQSISPESLPLVGFGCAGWLYELVPDLEENAYSLESAEVFLTEAFELFNHGKLQYIPDVPCSCSDFKIM